MPEMDGYELVDQVAKVWTKMDIYMVTAYSRDEYQEKAVNLGAKGLIAKPVSFKDLKELILSYREYL